MPRELLDEELLRALRAVPDQRLGELAHAVGLPRTNFGRPLTRRVQSHVQQLVQDGLVEELGGRYRLSRRGRQALGGRALGGNGARS
jgi:DNA-binding IclR family transcriptional regulator